MIINELMLAIEMGLIYGIVALGIYLSFRVINFPDLTCDGSFVLGTAICSVLIKSGCNPWIASIMAVMTGSLAGMMTGVLNTHFKVTDLLSGILVAFMLYSINLRVLSGMPNIALMDSNTIFSNISVWLILLIVGLGICVCMSYLFMTDFGLALRSIGQNKILAQNMGINVKGMTIIALALSNGLIALGGALFSQYQGFADIGSGFGTLIIGLASVMIGERLLSYRSMAITLASCLVGSIVYRLFISLALHNEVLGLQTQDLNLIIGLMIIAIMYIPKRRLC